MSYTIGQLRKSKVSNFLTSIGTTQNDRIVSTYFDNTEFNDVAITPAEALTADKNYFIRFSIKKMSADAYDGDNTQNITLRLYKSLKDYTDDDVQLLQSLPRIAAAPAGQEDWVTFEKVFTPDDSYAYIGLILSRSSYDYRYVNTAREVTLRVDAFGSVDNILPSVSKSFMKIGCQSKPGSLLCVNGEQIRIGRSGTYEVNNGVPITFFGFAGQNNEIGQFILDYAYDA